MAEIRCKFCNEWIAEGDYAIHIEDVHTKQIEASALLAITKPYDRILSILKHSPQAQSDAGELLNLYFRYFPFLGKYQIVYDCNTKLIEVPKMPYREFALFLKHVGTIGRIDRQVRAEHPELNGSTRARVKRAIEEQFSRKHWFMQGLIASHEPDAGQG